MSMVYDLFKTLDDNQLFSDKFKMSDVIDDVVISKSIVYLKQTFAVLNRSNTLLKSLENNLQRNINVITRDIVMEILWLDENHQISLK